MLQDKFEQLENTRVRKIKDNRYLPKGLINAYLDNRLSTEDQKLFEKMVGNIEGIEDELRIKTEVQAFIRELIPNPRISTSSRAHLKNEMADIADSVLGDDKINIKEKITNFLNMTVIEF